MHVIGIDYDSFKATVCRLEFESDRFDILELRWRKQSDTQGDASWRALRRVRETIADYRLWYQWDMVDDPPVWIERGYGPSRKSDSLLGQFLGAIVASWPVYNPEMISEIHVKEWRAVLTKEATGKSNGGIAKENVPAVLSSLGFDVSDLTLDATDALGIAWAGRHLNRKQNLLYD
jgi:hypothetical protein